MVPIGEPAGLNFQSPGAGMIERSSETGGAAPPSGHARQFLAWVAERPRTYSEAMEAWRTSCPRLSAWEDAIIDDLIRVDASGAASHGQASVRLTEKGAFWLDRPAPADQPPAGPS